MLVGEKKTFENKLLFDGFLEYAKINPEKIALYQEDEEVNYGTLMNQALRISKGLQKNGIQAGDLVMVSINRSKELIEAILGILFVGAVYIPVGTHQPEMRRNKILNSSKAKMVLQEEFVKECQKEEPLEEIVRVNPEEKAYIIFTSGSTGEPKGVVISHAGAMNTIEDVNDRFSITKEDCAIGVSAIDFDLSVYDIFGMLSVGGSLVLLKEEAAKNPDVWVEEIERRNVTIWNSVPALFDMLLTLYGNNENLRNLKNVLLSGDWLDLNTYGRMQKIMPETKLISLGGATEGSIWSNYYEVLEVKEDWNSIPYGVPLANQKFLTMGEDGKESKTNEIGELWIGGRGVAIGYTDPELTKKSFVDYKGERWYRTGDYGKIDENGIMEFCGRRDLQVKMNGFRIELGEIEKVISSHPNVKEVKASIIEEGSGKKIGIGIVPNYYSENLQAIDLNNDSLLETFTEDNEQKNLLYSFLYELLIEEKTIFSNEYQHLKEGYEVFLENAKDMKKQTEFSGELNKIYEVLKENKEMYKKIFTGEVQNFALLDIKELSPEFMAFSDRNTICALESAIKDIKETYEKTGKKQKVLVTDTQTGLFVEKIWTLLEGTPVELKVLTLSRSFYLDTKNRFKDEDDIEVVFVENGRYQPEFYNMFDVVLSIHQLHTYKKNQMSVMTLNYYLKENGHAYIIEQNQLQPLAFLTSAVLENGFAGFDMGREKNFSPMLSATQWMERMEQSGLKKVKREDYENVYLLIVENPAKRITKEEIVDYAKANLTYYMVPERIEFIMQFEKSENGKIIRNIFKNAGTKEEEEEVFEGFALEIAELWKSILNVEKISSKKNFFEMGGDSLLLTKLLAKIKERYGVEYSMKQMFDTPYLIQMAENIEKLMEENDCDTYLEEGEI